MAIGCSSLPRAPHSSPYSSSPMIPSSFSYSRLPNLLFPAVDACGAIDYGRVVFRPLCFMDAFAASPLLGFCDRPTDHPRRMAASKRSSILTENASYSKTTSEKARNIQLHEKFAVDSVATEESANAMGNCSKGLTVECFDETISNPKAEVEVDKEGSAKATDEALFDFQIVNEGGGYTLGQSEEEEAVSPELLAREIARRRNFAIISHPDAGKTTFTEKLLLYGGAIHQAGAVKARRAARHATSDWMELEKQRGISITSTALVFETNGSHITLLDTPGHQDFGEDTYRTLAAADNAVMLVDAGKGLEPQTRKLFEVCKMRKLPIFTFINKLDRPALQPLDLLDQIEQEFGLVTHPVTWPIGSGDRFVGVYYRPNKEVHLFKKGESHGSKEATVQILPWGDPTLKHAVAEDLYKQLEEEIELLDALASPLDKEMVYAGNLTPVYFGSAMNNFGVKLFLESFLECSMQPRKHESDIGEINPDYAHLTGFIFKLQANMDPKHRDKVAFVRICSGQFRKGMKVKVYRTGKSISLSRPQKMFAQDRSTVETGFAGDVIGLNNPNAFCLGDTIYCGKRLSYPGIPSFSPELFCYVRNPNPSKYKQFQKGLFELLGEGAVQVLYSVDSGRGDAILAAVGQLQFEVVQYRMLSEYGVEAQLESLPYSVARWVVGGWPAVQNAGKLYNCETVKDQWGRPVLLFRNEWNLLQLTKDNKSIGDLVACALPPEEISRKR